MTSPHEKALEACIQHACAFVIKRQILEEILGIEHAYTEIEFRRIGEMCANDLLYAMNNSAAELQVLIDQLTAEQLREYEVQQIMAKLGGLYVD